MITLLHKCVVKALKEIEEIKYVAIDRGQIAENSPEALITPACLISYEPITIDQNIGNYQSGVVNFTVKLVTAARLNESQEDLDINHLLLSDLINLKLSGQNFTSSYLSINEDFTIANTISRNSYNLDWANNEAVDILVSQQNFSTYCFDKATYGVIQQLIDNLNINIEYQ